MNAPDNKEGGKAAARKKRGLGRGLDALFSDAEASYSAPDAPAPADVSDAPASAAQSRGGLRTLPLEKLQPGKYQPRQEFDEDAIDELAQSIRERGLIQPILVRAVAGDTYIMFVEWDATGEMRSRSIHQYGSATLDRMSPHYADQAPLFASEQWRPALLTRADVEANAARTYRPGK